MKQILRRDSVCVYKTMGFTKEAEAKLDQQNVSDTKRKRARAFVEQMQQRTAP